VPSLPFAISYQCVLPPTKVLRLTGRSADRSVRGIIWQEQGALSGPRWRCAAQPRAQPLGGSGEFEVATMTDQERDRFLAEPRYGIPDTLRSDGSPIAVPVWFDWNGETVRMFTSVL